MPATIASRLATAIQTNLGGAVTATPSGSTITLQSTATGAATNSVVAVSVVDTTDGITAPSFAVAAVNMSGGTDAGGMTGGSPVYSYSLAGNFSAVGDVLGYTDLVMGAWTFNYDKLDRLTSANGPSSQSMAYAYDSFGNRWPTNQSHATSWSQFTTQNQVPVNNGVSYDAAGNVTSLAGLHSFVYDDENRVASVDGSTSYLYDAEGNRVAKGSWSGSTFTPSAIYLLGPDNIQVTELDGSGLWKHSNVYASGKMLATYDVNGVHYQLADWLGTRRVQTNASGVIDETCQSYPFGDNLNCTGPGYDATEQHFTGKQHDTESGLDYFGARYLASSTGRWMSPDWSAKEDPVPYANMDDPQSLNLYGYVLNNPLSHVDSDGHCCDWSAIGEYVAGFTQGVASSLTGGAVGAPSPTDSPSSLAGQVAGSSVVGTLGADTAIASGPAAGAGLVGAPETGGISLVATVVAPAATAVGTAVAVGAAKNIAAIGVAIAKKADVVTSSGQKANEHGQKLGPSGKPQVNNVKSNTREGAKNAANKGSGTVEHPNPKEGDPHFHTARGDGSKVQDNTHYKYPK